MSTISRNSRTHRRVPMVLTLSRIVIGPLIAAAVMDRAEMAVAVLLTVFVAVDWADGVLARRAGVDNLVRRAADAVVDRVAIHVAFVAFVVEYDTVPAIWVALVARDLLQACINVQLLPQGTALGGGALHRVGGLLAAASGWSLVAGSAAGAVLVPTATVVVAVTTVAYVGRSGRYLAAKPRDLGFARPRWL